MSDTVPTESDSMAPVQRTSLRPVRKSHSQFVTRAATSTVPTATLAPPQPQNPEPATATATATSSVAPPSTPTYWPTSASERSSSLRSHSLMKQSVPTPSVSSIPIEQPEVTTRLVADTPYVIPSRGYHKPRPPPRNYNNVAMDVTPPPTSVISPMGYYKSAPYTSSPVQAKAPLTFVSLPQPAYDYTLVPASKPGPKPRSAPAP